MKNRLISFLFFFCFTCVCMAKDKKTVDFTIVTEEYPPYNYTENGKLTGCCYDLTVEILKRLNLNYPIKMTTWNEAYDLTLFDPKYIIFSINRTQARETLFKWVGPLYKNKWGFFAAADKNLKIESLKDVEKYKIGTYYNDVCEEFLCEKKLKYECVDKDSDNLKRLLNGEIDLWIVADIPNAYLVAKREGVDTNKFRLVYQIRETSLYIGFNRKAPDKIVDRFQKTLNSIKKDGTYDKIMKKYKQALTVPITVTQKSSGVSETELTIKLKKQSYKELKAIADKKGKSCQKVISEALDAYIETNKLKKK